MVLTFRASSLALLTAVALAAATATCTHEPEPPDRTIGSYGTRVGELQVCADGPTVPGIDVSKWQGDIDWSAVQGSGVVFAFIRVSHGTNIIDEYFVDNWTEAESVGLLRGVYQYFSPSQDPIEQADILLDALALHGAGELPPVIDVEETDGQTAATIADRVGRWLSHVEAELGVRPIIYTGSYFWNDHVETTAFADNPLWIAHWGATCPNLPTAWADWVFWQTSATGDVPGISGDVDLDVFNGNVEALLAFGVDPECQADATYQACVGDLLRYCDETSSLVSTDCAANGEVCSAFGGVAHCADSECVDYLDSSETGAFCFDDFSLGECLDGQLQESDCSASGRVCEEVSDSAACVEPPHSGGDSNMPDAGSGDTGADAGDAAGGTDAQPASPGLARFAEVPESGLSESHCQVGGRVASPGWLTLLTALSLCLITRRRHPTRI